MDTRNLEIKPDTFYHIYNRGINGETIFKTKSNYYFFLEKLDKYLSPLCEIYAYCLIPNHFHLLVKVNESEELLKFFEFNNSSNKNYTKGIHSPSKIFSKQFSRIFNSYSQAYNKENKRHGSLIESPFRRKVIDDENYLKQLIIYIHLNPQKHNLINDFRAYPFSSYQILITESETNLNRKKVFELFEDKSNFKYCHLD